MEDKNSPQVRQRAIQELIGQALISDQKKLVKLLLDKYGISTNQAVVSRDLRRLGVIKKQVNDGFAYALPLNDVNAEILKLAVIDANHNEAMIVIKTHPGLAAFVGDCIDQHTDLNILGCLAGENVVFVTPRSLKQMEATFQALCKKIHFKILGS